MVGYFHFNFFLNYETLQVRNNKQQILQDLEQALQEQAPPAQQENTGLHELPPLVIDGIPTQVDKMTQVT